MATTTFIQPNIDQWGNGGSEDNTDKRNAGTGQNDVPATASITHNWSNPGNITSELSLGAASLNSSISNPPILPYLRASNFGFNIPSAATLVGIETELAWGSGSSSDYIESEIRLAWGASAANLSTDNNGDGASVPGSAVTEERGGPTDLWGELASTLTPAVVSSSDFGFVIKLTRPTGTGSRTAFIDCMRMRVYYSLTDPLDGNVRVTQLEAMALVTEAKEVRVTQVYAEVLTNIPVTSLTYPAGTRSAVVLIAL